MPSKYFDGFGRNVTGYVADLEAKAKRLVEVEKELAALKAASADVTKIDGSQVNANVTSVASLPQESTKTAGKKGKK